MKRILLTIAVAIGTAVAEESPKISTICTDVKGDLKEFNYDNAKNIAKAITATNKKFNDLCDKIDKAKSYEEVFPEIVKTIDEVATDYENIAKNKEKISTSLTKHINDVASQRTKCDREIARLNSLIATTERRYNTETIDYRKTALETTLKFQRQELQVWTKFKEDLDFGTLGQKMNDAKGNIIRFIDILDYNAQVYRAASNTLKTIQDYKNATQALKEVLDVMDLGDQLVASWSRLSVVIDGAISHIESVEAKY